MSGVEIVAGSVGTTLAAASGLAVLGEVGGLLGGLAAVVGLVISALVGNARTRRKYDEDKRNLEAERRSTAQLVDELTETRRERDDYRDRYLGLLENRSGRQGGR